MKIFSISLLFICSSAFAEPYLTITCGELAGDRFDYIKGSIEKDTDKYSGIHPTFIIKKANSDIVSIIWGTKVDDEPPTASTKKAKIVSKGTNQFSAIRTVSAGTLLEVYSFFPSNGLLYYAEHSFGFPILDGATSKSMYTKCKFSYAP